MVLGCGPGGPPGPYFLEWVVCFLEWLVVFSNGFVCFLEWLCKIQGFLAFWHPRGSKTVGKCMFLCFLRAAVSQTKKKTQVCSARVPPNHFSSNPPIRSGGMRGAP